MRHLSSALYCEGPSDARFLRPLLRRLCESVAALSVETVEVADVLVLDDEPQHRALSRAERIEKAAVAADGAWIVLFIHADADRPTTQEALEQRVWPAIERLRGRLGPRRQAVAVVPVRATDAWVIADTEAFRSSLGTSLSDEVLGLSSLALHGPERVADPKAMLRSAFRAARPRARPASLAGYLDLIGETVSLDRLRQLRAFSALEADLLAAARALHLVPPTVRAR